MGARAVSALRYPVAARASCGRGVAADLMTVDLSRQLLNIPLASSGVVVASVDSSVHPDA